MGLVYTGKVAGKAAVQGKHTAGSVAVLGGLAQPIVVTAGSAVTAAHMSALQAAAAAAKTAHDNNAATTGLATARANLATAVAAQDAAAIATATTALSTAQTTYDAAATTVALRAADAAVVGASGTAAVAAKDSMISLEKRMTVNMSGSVETTSGLTFGAALNLRSNERTGTVSAGARVHMATNGLELAVGNIYGAIDSMPGLYKSVGLTGLGWGGVVANTAAKGAFAWDSYSSSGNGPEGVEVIYSAGSFTGHLSYTDTDLGSFGNTTAAHVSYAMGDWTVAVAMQDSDVNANDKTIVTVGGKVGDFGVGFAAADNDGETKIVLNGSATMGATTISAYITDEETAANNPMGVGFKHDLGGASLVGGVARTAGGQTLADMGVSFSF